MWWVHSKHGRGEVTDTGRVNRGRNAWGIKTSMFSCSFLYCVFLLALAPLKLMQDWSVTLKLIFCQWLYCRLWFWRNCLSSENMLANLACKNCTRPTALSSWPSVVLKVCEIQIMSIIAKKGFHLLTSYLAMSFTSEKSFKIQAASARWHACYHHWYYFDNE